MTYQQNWFVQNVGLFRVALIMSQSSILVDVPDVWNGHHVNDGNTSKSEKDVQQL